MAAVTVVRAFTLDQTARLGRVSQRQAAYWANHDVLQPSVLFDGDRRPTRNLYSFQDVVGLRVIGILRNKHGVSLQMLRKAGARLTRHTDNPWSGLSFWVRGKELFFFDPDQRAMLSTDGKNQITTEIELDRVAADVEHDADVLSQRTKHDLGKTEQSRNVLRNRLVVKGTRVPVDSIFNLAGAGYDISEIVAAYPSLTLTDVEIILATHSSLEVA